jgi:hypothetical protein
MLFTGRCAVKQLSAGDHDNSNQLIEQTFKSPWNLRHTSR